MQALVVFCHPNPASFNAAVLETILGKLRAAGAEAEDIRRRMRAVSRFFDTEFETLGEGLVCVPPPSA